MRTGMMAMLDLDCPHAATGLTPHMLHGVVSSMLGGDRSSRHSGAATGGGGRALFLGGATLTVGLPYSVLLVNSMPYYYDTWTLRSR